MTISNLEEIECPNGHVFEAELLSAISVSDNPKLKNLLIDEEINLVSCPECGKVFYAECFILYHDSKNELIAFVYPLSFQNQAVQCKIKMRKEFELALENFEEKQKINYEPLMLFGIEDLVLLLLSEQDIEDEEAVLKCLASKLLLDTADIAPSLARKLKIPKVLPFPRGGKKLEAKSLISGLRILIEHNSNLLHYVEFLKKISEYETIFEDIKDDIN
ncbi:MAG: CpXC domain-containing protein [Endomicrobium sp.]|nr:CpXC domain-containing protein [Endomicrobium sp.]